MGIVCSYPVPRHVKDAVDEATLNELGDIIVALDIPDSDAPIETDHYDWMRQRILDFLYDPDWRSP